MTKEIPLSGKNISPSSSVNGKGDRPLSELKRLQKNLNIIFTVPSSSNLRTSKEIFYTWGTEWAKFELKHWGVASEISNRECDSCKQGLYKRFQIKCFSLLILCQLRKIIWYSKIRVSFCCVNHTQRWILGYRRGMVFQLRKILFCLASFRLFYWKGARVPQEKDALLQIIPALHIYINVTTSSENWTACKSQNIKRNLRSHSSSWTPHLKP